MIKTLILSLGLFFNTLAQSNQDYTITNLINDLNQTWLQDIQIINNRFVKGDFAKYNLKLGFISGKMEMNVLDVTPEGVWLQQLINMGFVGKQDIRQLMDPQTGEIKRFIINGEEKTPPTREDFEIIEQKEDTVKVPAGTFKCVYLKANVKANEEKMITEQWVNPVQIPVMGIAKLVTETKMGTLTALLTSFKRH